ncbi:hypothetical protein VNO78_26779 [Psophocarpus tetragonolobus]|uniref:Uncharacterized protein n=1 Tax=Psophocarpus tetragonolobus TaxID=3891 RepID=A0AAN9XB48_PSOTE
MCLGLLTRDTKQQARWSGLDADSIINEISLKLVMKLKAMLSREQGFETDPLGGYTEIGREQIVESMSETLRGSNKPWGKSDIEPVVDQSFCSVALEDYNTVSLPHWPVAPY